MGQFWLGLWYKVTQRLKSGGSLQKVVQCYPLNCSGKTPGSSLSHLSDDRQWMMTNNGCMTMDVISDDRPRMVDSGQWQIVDDRQ